MRVWMIGCGNMAGAMLTRWIESGAVKAEAVDVVNRKDRALPAGVRQARALPTGAAPDIVVLGVKPQQLDEVAGLYADRVAGAVERQLATLPTGETARVAWETNGAIILVPTLADACPLTDRLAPEHVEIATDDPRALFDRLRHAGSAFLGRHTPEAIGDYVAGPNHVLPTGRRARFASGLGVTDFMKRTSFLELDAAALGKLGPATVALADAEGLPAHAASVALRLAKG